jgi:tetratricopeptide (TPR) repeat protein
MRDISTFFLQIAFTILYASNSSSVVTILDSVFTSSVVSSDVFPLFFVWLSSILESLTVKAPFKRSSFSDKNETHSFSEWLQLSKISPIVRDEEEKQPEVSSELEKKFDLIEKFIELNPKIPQAKDSTSIPANVAKSNEMPSSIMTETLAQIYLEQKKYTKAIQAYDILILKYPEKSSFFADRIKNIKILQQNN